MTPLPVSERNTRRLEYRNGGHHVAALNREPTQPPAGLGVEGMSAIRKAAVDQLPGRIATGIDESTASA
jgi:hypothetical protein